MNIEKNKVIKVDYVLKNSEGTIIDSSEGMEPLEYLHGHNNIIAGLESALEGKKVGDDFNISVHPAQAYGERDENAFTLIPLEKLQHIPNLEVGLKLQIPGPNGAQIVTISKIDDKEVTIDTNHPLAGELLNFDVKVIDIRDASEEEISHGHIHIQHQHGEEQGCSSGGGCSGCGQH